SHAPFYRWFTGGELNTCYNAVDRHVENGRGEQAALIYDSPITQTIRTYTYNQLLDAVARFAGVLASLGVRRGDRVILYMPMVPEAPIAMLACARLGAIHSVVFGGFAPRELAVRIDDCTPKVIVSASCGIEPSRVIAYKPLLDEAIERATHKPSACVILQRPQLQADLVPGRDREWGALMTAAQPVACTPVLATDPLYILYTSGTTGQPKGVVRDNGGHAVALCNTMGMIYGISAGDVFWTASDVGWVVGHSYIVYGPLLAGATTILFEGKPVGTPDAGVFWRIVAQHKVRALFTAPTAFRAVKREDPDGELIRRYDLRDFQTLFLAGERCDPPTLEWAQKMLRIPVIDHWWQTETGSAIVSNYVRLDGPDGKMMPIKAGSPTKAAPGWDV
ncbi:MAG: AMP-binding protein, partial [Vulcanimicrobiaceae bacterium]